METIIRPYQPTDIEACRALWAELTQAHRDLYEDQTIGGENPDAGFDRHLANPQLAALWVAEAGGQVVGVTGLLVQGKEAEIEPLVVAAGHRAHGIGRRLLDQAMSEARAGDSLPERAPRGAQRCGHRPVRRGRFSSPRAD